MAQKLYQVTVSHMGKSITNPVFATLSSSVKLEVDENLITKMANSIGYNPKVVKINFSEDKNKAA